MPTSPDFAQRVYDIVAEIPRGRVTTYGHIARTLGDVRGAHGRLSESSVTDLQVRSATPRLSMRWVDQLGLGRPSLPQEDGQYDQYAN